MFGSVTRTDGPVRNLLLAIWVQQSNVNLFYGKATPKEEKFRVEGYAKWF